MEPNKTEQSVETTRYVEDYLEYFEWNLNMKSPSVTGGLQEKEENE